jgi:hypothetical protein
MAKYTEDDRKAMAAKGHAMPDGSYPIADADDLDNAIHAVGRGGADHDAIRRHVIKRAAALGLSSKIPDNWTADGSLQGQASAGRDPKWEQRRKRWAGSLLRQAARRAMQMEMRAKPDGTGGVNFEFEGYGAVFDAPFEMWDPWGDPYTEVVVPGAFTRSLARPDLYVPFLIGHDQATIPLAQTANGTMRLSQDSRGLHVVAQMDGRRSDVRNLAYAVERGDMDQMSIGFMTEGQEWSKDYMQRSMLDLNLHQGDVSSVAVAANPATAGAMMTAFPVEGLSAGPAAEFRDGGGSPDDNTPDYDPQPHAAPGHMVCPSSSCPVEGGALNSVDAKYCDQCGQGLYSQDGTILVNSDGVPVALDGDGETSQALERSRALLELRTRQLALLG